MTRSQSAAPALAGQCLDARDLVVLGDAGTHRVGFAVVRAVEVAAAGDDEVMFLAELSALGHILGAVAGVMHLDAVDGPLATSSRSRGILLYTVGWANTTTAPAAFAVASTSRTGG